MLDWMNHNTPVDICYEKSGLSANFFRVWKVDDRKSSAEELNNTAEVSAAVAGATEAPLSPSPWPSTFVRAAPEQRDAADNTPATDDTDPQGWYFKLHQNKE
jgi:hypothetical protein